MSAKGKGYIGIGAPLGGHGPNVPATGYIGTEMGALAGGGGGGPGGGGGIDPEDGGIICPCDPPAVIPEQDAISSWLLNEATGLTRADSVGANNLADNNTVTRVTGHTGGGSFAAHFTRASNQFLSVASNTSLEITPDGGFTVFGWINPDSYGDPGTYIFSKGELAGVTPPPGDTADWAAYIDFTGHLTFFINDGQGATGSALVMLAIVPLATWTFFSVRYDRSRCKLTARLNAGDREELCVGGFDVDRLAGQFCIGCKNDALIIHNFDGAIDNIQYWKRALTNTEEIAFFNTT